MKRISDYLFGPVVVTRLGYISFWVLLINSVLDYINRVTT